jgi:ribonuclease HII
VSAAAILAKSRCDRALAELDATYPGYGLAKHKGYRTKEHLLAVRRLGPSPTHRHRSTEKPVDANYLLVILACFSRVVEA